MKILRAILFSPAGAALIFVLGCTIWANAQVYLWSGTVPLNNQSPGQVRFNVGGPPSMLEDSFRQVMADIAAYKADVVGDDTASESGGTYTLTSNAGFTSLSALNNQKICFLAQSTNTGNDNLNVDGLGAKPILANGGAALNTGVIVSGTPYCVTYLNGTPAFYLFDYYGDASATPIGAMVDYVGTSAPNSDFAIANGQCISQTTYATLFGIIGSTYGSCGSGLFGLPDMRSRVSAGVGNMGGGDNGVLDAYCTPTIEGSTCGVQQIGIAQANLPNYTLPDDLGFTGNLSTVSINQGAVVPNAQDGIGVELASGVNFVGQNSFGATFTVTPTGSINGSVSLGGSGTALRTVQPTMFLYKLIRIQ